MRINRLNYEEFFILYLDNELSNEERRELESFVQLHPDLKEELDLFRQFKMEPDTAITFTGKEELLKTQSIIPIDLTNYEEWFTLYYDNELTAAEKTAVDQFVIANPPLEKDWLTAQKLKLQPEEIVFTDKALLYRSAASEKARFIPLRLWRVAAAVILLLGISFALFSIFSKKPAGGVAEEFANTVKKQPGTTPVTITPKGAESTIPDQLAFDETKKKNETVSVVKNTVEPVVTTVPANKVTSLAADKDHKNAIPVIKETPSNNLPAPVDNPNILPPSPINSALAANNLKEENVKTRNQQHPIVTNIPSSPSDFKQAVAKETPEINQDDSKTNKLRGFFRKITRTLEKRANIDATDDDDRLLVAGLAIKLK